MKKEGGKLQSDAYEYGDDEERFAMEKVHGASGFEEGEDADTKMDEGNEGGDDDWRALASQAPPQPPPEASPPNSAVAEADGIDQPLEAEQQTTVEASQQMVSSGTGVVASQETGKDKEAGPGEMLLACSNELRIMRFPRKKTTIQRSRRKDVKFISLHQIMDQAKLEADAVPSPNPGTTVKTEVDNVKPEATAASPAPAPIAAKVESNICSVNKAFEPKCVLVKARSFDDVDTDLDADKERKSMKVSDAKRLRLKQVPRGEQQKPKAMAFQKSRNIINKRISVDTAKPEAKLNVDCSEVKAMQEKYSSVMGEWKALQEEIRATSPRNAEAVKELASEVHERWIVSGCKQLKMKFDLHFAVVDHFLSHKPQTCSTKPVS